MNRRTGFRRLAGGLGAAAAVGGVLARRPNVT